MKVFFKGFHCLIGGVLLIGTTHLPVFSKTCSELLNSIHAVSQDIKSTDSYELLWTNQTTLDYFPRGTSVSHWEGWIECDYDERGFERYGNMTCGERLFGTNGRSVSSVFDSEGVPWKTVYLGIVETKSEECRISDEGEQFFNEGFRVYAFKLNINGYLFFIKKTTIQEFSIYRPEF